MTKKKIASISTTDEKGVGVEDATNTEVIVKEDKVKSNGGQSTRRRNRYRRSRSKKKGQQQQNVERVGFLQQIGSPNTERPDPENIEKAAFTLECEICCSTDVSTDQITTCSLGHIFCKSCARQMAETQLGMNRSTLPCMAMEGCTASFDEAEIREFLDATAFSLWQRLRFEDDVKAAGVGDLEHCPSCHFACFIENEHERLFRCLNASCRRVSCRSCKREDHLPKSCHEYEWEIQEKDRHRAEELLSAVLVRRCPQKKCDTPIVKEETSKSCNRMKCTVCKKEMCYVCRKDISMVGYRHFNMVEEAHPSPPSDKCPLWEDTLERHKMDLEAARQRLGRIAPTSTQVDRADEARRRCLLEMQTQASLEMQFADLHFELEHGVEDVIQDFPDRDQARWNVHNFVRQRKQSEREREERDARRQREELLSHRQHAQLHQSLRLEALGMADIVSVPKKASRWQLGEPIHL